MYYILETYYILILVFACPKKGGFFLKKIVFYEKLIIEKLITF
jgi:hypothetical protein